MGGEPLRLPVPQVESGSARRLFWPPECFIVERKLRARMKIPVFHDDQHGTAIIVGAAVTNGLKVVGKNIADVKLVVSGAGAAALRLSRPADRSRARA